MPALFVAVDLPTEMTLDLASIQPPREPGIRLVRPGQMHLTLHYLGKGSIPRTSAALEQVEAEVFPLSLAGVGLFPTGNGTVTLWAGVADSPALHGLHTSVATALQATGFRPELRPYTPHLTLARCGPKVSPRTIEDFLVLNRCLTLPAVPITSFSLYSSTRINNIPTYHRERAFPLLKKGTGTYIDSHASSD